MAVIEGIARRRVVTARYNDQLMRLAPHALFARHGELFVSALNMSKNWRSAEDRRLGQFKLAGLADVAVIDEPFEPLPEAAASGSNERDEMLLKVA